MKQYYLVDLCDKIVYGLGDILKARYTLKEALYIADGKRVTIISEWIFEPIGNRKIFFIEDNESYSKYNKSANNSYQFVRLMPTKNQSLHYSLIQFKQIIKKVKNKVFFTSQFQVEATNNRFQPVIEHRRLFIIKEENV